MQILCAFNSEFGNQQRRRQKTKLLYIWAKTYITKLLKALVFLLNNPEIPWSSNSKWIHIKHRKRLERFTVLA
jgi:hypothetical protein